MLAAAFLLLASCQSHLDKSNEQVENAPKAPRIVLYRVSDDSINDIDFGLLEINGLKILPKPLFTEDQIVSYDWQAHQLELTESGLENIPKRGQFYLGTCFFIVTVDGVRIYGGSFESTHCSESHSWPTIVVDQSRSDIQSGDRISNIRELVENKTSPLTIALAYPNDSFADPNGDDRRNNALLKSVLKEIGKLKE